VDRPWRVANHPLAQPQSECIPSFALLFAKGGRAGMNARWTHAFTPRRPPAARALLPDPPKITATITRNAAPRSTSVLRQDAHESDWDERSFTVDADRHQEENGAR
jgi:hypothetical protein